MYRLLAVSDVVMCVQTQGRTTRRSTQSRAKGQNRKVSDDAYARQLVRTTHETYAQRLKDAGKPLPAITREALEKQREERRTGLGQSVKQDTGQTHNEPI
ncbi:hypothetical protein JG688_00014260 [Phytophthora aleatoria]|uniref:Uncharacterized protein n=1 Tax=Phytophthora aleatoria TaxID=2496075 RepID=A0A8J5IXA7_9STRA|nr:hypothetical protein JG688_00014260 [Phytophthora aleatoria]